MKVIFQATDAVKENTRRQHLVMEQTLVATLIVSHDDRFSSKLFLSKAWPHTIRTALCVLWSSAIWPWGVQNFVHGLRLHWCLHRCRWSLHGIRINSPFRNATTSVIASLLVLDGGCHCLIERFT